MLRHALRVVEAEDDRGEFELVSVELKLGRDHRALELEHERVRALEVARDGQRKVSQLVAAQRHRHLEHLRYLQRAAPHWQRHI